MITPSEEKAWESIRKLMKRHEHLGHTDRKHLGDILDEMRDCIIYLMDNVGQKKDE